MSGASEQESVRASRVTFEKFVNDINNECTIVQNSLLSRNSIFYFPTSSGVNERANE